VPHRRRHRQVRGGLRLGEDLLPAAEAHERVHRRRQEALEQVAVLRMTSIGTVRTFRARASIASWLWPWNIAA
jgi:hypothetical protein